MDTGRPTKTLADYLVIAVSPALIIVLVHSLCFFLVEVFFRPETVAGVRWLLFWFGLAVVLIARIGIEQGVGHAMGYGLALAGATWIYLALMQINVIFGAILLGVLWFTAHKLTSNCTLVDDDFDASGQGLMQSLKRFTRPFHMARKNGPPAEPTETPARARNPGATRTPVKPAPASEKSSAARSPAPGVWLLYYSFAALLLFGLGQKLLPAGDAAARHRSFIHLFCYLAAALGLLVTTSFLGLRRYLRQRYLVMPGRIVLGWMQVGVVGVILIMCLSLLLPRPGTGEAWGALRYQVDHQVRRASEYAARFNPHGTGAGRAGRESQSANQPNTPPPPSGQGSNPNPKPDQTTGANDQADPHSSASAREGAAEGQAGGQQPGRSAPDLSSAAGSLYPWLMALVYLLAAIGVVWLGYRYRAVIVEALRKAAAAIREFFAALLGLGSTNANATPPGGRATEVRSFKPFKNPFLTGGDRVWSPEQLIRYSFEALQNWALERAAPEGTPQTPREFCRQLGGEIPEAAAALDHLAFLYGHVAYGASVPANLDREQLRLLWQLMSGPRPKYAAAAAAELEQAIARQP